MNRWVSGPGRATGTGFATPGAISGDGRFVVFGSFATNLVPGDTNGAIDIFVHDRLTGTTVRASVRTDGGEGNDASLRPSINGDGSLVTFSSTPPTSWTATRTRYATSSSTSWRRA